MPSNDAAHRAQIIAASKARAHLTPPKCADCGRECPPHARGGYRICNGRCESCTRRNARRLAAIEEQRAELPPLKASDSGYGPYGVTRLDMAS